jgi:hypothetical protein
MFSSAPYRQIVAVKLVDLNFVNIFASNGGMISVIVSGRGCERMG